VTAFASAVLVAGLAYAGNPPASKGLIETSVTTTK